MATKYKLEMKRVAKKGSIPLWLTGWRTLLTNADFSELQPFLRQGEHCSMRKLTQMQKATLLDYLETPNWTAEQYDKYNSQRGSNSSLPSVVDKVRYRVTPNIDISLVERI